MSIFANEHPKIVNEIPFSRQNDDSLEIVLLKEQLKSARLEISSINEKFLQQKWQISDQQREKQQLSEIVERLTSEVENYRLKKINEDFKPQMKPQGEILTNIPTDNARLLQSSLLSQEAIVELFQELKWSKAVKIYSATEHGDSSSQFHSNCDEKGPTLSVVKATNSNVIFGGFTPIPCTSTVGCKKENANSSFLFRFEDKFERFSFLMEAKYHYKATFGPSFGEGDLHISDGCCSNNSSQSNPFSYNIPSKNTLCGSENFTVENYEVFQLEL